ARSHSPSEPASEPAAPASWPYRLLDGFAASPHCFAGVVVPSYRALGIVGVVAGFAVLCGLGVARGAPLAFLVTLSISALTAFVAAGWLRRRLLGRERHVLLEDVLIVLGVGAALARLERQPVAASLDLEVLALGTFLVFGRLGCLAAGCCHGRP